MGGTITRTNVNGWVDVLMDEWFCGGMVMKKILELLSIVKSISFFK